MSGGDLVREWYERTAEIAELAEAVVATCDPKTKASAKTVDPLRMAPLRAAIESRNKLAIRMLKAGVALPSAVPSTTPSTGPSIPPANGHPAGSTGDAPPPPTATVG